jgi:hypothetical protein
VDRRTRWHEIQVAFVDDPRRAVDQADRLVADVLRELAQRFADERARLEQQWNQGEPTSTEDLRLILQQYRTFFDALLQMPARSSLQADVQAAQPSPESEESPQTGGTAGDEEIIEIPVIEEQLVKQPVVKEVLRIRKSAVGEQQTVREALRKEEVEIERDPDVAVHEEQ